MSWHKHIVGKFDAWAFDSFGMSAQGWATYRVFLALYLIWFFLPWPGARTWLADIPNELWTPPPGPMMMFGGFPSGWAILGIEIAALLAAVFLLFGIGRRCTPVLLGTLIFLYQGFLYSTGKIDHSSHLLIASVFVCAFSPWMGTNVEKEDTNIGTGWPLTFLALLVGFAMLTAGADKFLQGWLWTTDQAVQNVTYRQVGVDGRESLLAEPMLSTLPWTVWEVLDWATVFFEIGFFFAAISPRWFRIFCAGAVVFHAGVASILSISFVHQLPVYAAFLDWDRISHHPQLMGFKENLSNIWESASVIGHTGIVAASLVTIAGVKVGLVDVLNSVKFAGTTLTTQLLFATALTVIATRICPTFVSTKESTRE